VRSEGEQPEGPHLLLMLPLLLLQHFPHHPLPRRRRERLLHLSGHGVQLLQLCGERLLSHDEFEAVDLGPDEVAGEDDVAKTESDAAEGGSDAVKVELDAFGNGLDADGNNQTYKKKISSETRNDFEHMWSSRTKGTKC
jgi:hypothetical protein